MTSEDAMLLMIGGVGGGSLPDVVEGEFPTNVEYKDTSTYYGDIIEHYRVGKEDEFSKRVEVSFSNKGTPNEMVNSLYFYNENDKQVGYISFSGFYVG